MTNFAPYFSDMRPPNKKILVIIPALFLVVGWLCSGCNTVATPKDILPQDKLTRIMIEFYLGEARLTNYSIPYDSAHKLFIPFEASVLKKYGVSDSTLSRTYQYYFDHPIELEKIYEVVLDSLSLRERKATSAPPIAK